MDSVIGTQDFLSIFSFDPEIRQAYLGPQKLPLTSCMFLPHAVGFSVDGLEF